MHYILPPAGLFYPHCSTQYVAPNSWAIPRFALDGATERSLLLDQSHPIALGKWSLPMLQLGGWAIEPSAPDKQLVPVGSSEMASKKYPKEI
jgi:hypothetical protein